MPNPTPSSGYLKPAIGSEMWANISGHNWAKLGAIEFS